MEKEEGLNICKRTVRKVENETSNNETKQEPVCVTIYVE